MFIEFSNIIKDAILFVQTFSEELIDPSNPSSVRVINLKPNGADIAVTEDNKLEYLDLLAQYRLSVRIKEQTEQVRQL